MTIQLRVARPVTSLTRSATLYKEGLGFVEIGSFKNHSGFDGIMIGNPELSYHFEFTICRSQPVKPSPTHDDLLVFYIPDEQEWGKTCANMLDAGFVEVESFNPYWQLEGRTFEDPDGYRIVIQRAFWLGINTVNTDR